MRKLRYLPDKTRIFSTIEVSQILGVSTSTLTKWIQSGHFPSPEYFEKTRQDGKVGKRKLVGWRENTLKVWSKEMKKKNGDKS